MFSAKISCIAIAVAAIAALGASNGSALALPLKTMPQSIQMQGASADGLLLRVNDTEADDNSCDPEEDCTKDTSAKPKPKKTESKKKKKAGAASGNDDCDPGEDCSSDSD